MNQKSSAFLDKNGFVMIVICLSMAPLIVLMSYGWLRLSQLNDLRWLRENCRQILEPAQNRSGKSLEKLLQRNFVVRALKAEKVTAYAALAAAAASYNYPAMSAARHWIASIHKRQKVVRLEQKGLIRLAEAELTQAQLEVFQSSQVFARGTRLLYSMSLESAFPLPARMAVRTTQVEEFPEYELIEPFPERQAVELKWLVRFTGKQTGVKKWIPFDLNFPERCGVTLKHENGFFQTKLRQDKFFSNP